MNEYTNSQISLAIDDFIHDAKHRDILKDRLINGMIYEDLAEKYNYSTRQIKRIVYREQKILFDKMSRL